jgi:hypothetical protein
MLEPDAGKAIRWRLWRDLSPRSEFRDRAGDFAGVESIEEFAQRIAAGLLHETEHGKRDQERAESPHGWAQIPRPRAVMVTGFIHFVLDRRLIVSSPLGTPPIPAA